MFTELTTAYARDDDPELIWAAAPFALKTIDGFLLRNPRDTKLLLAATIGYTQYAYGGLVQDADLIEKTDYDRAVHLRRRACRLLIRARDYGIRGAATVLPGFEDKLRSDPAAALSAAEKKDVPLLFWTACAWGAAISLGKDDPELMADLFIVEAIMKRVMELDEEFDLGSPHDFMISLEGARNGNGGTYESAEKHYRRALEISGGRRASVHVTFAEAVLLPKQKRAEFVAELEAALKIPVEATPDQRLANIIAQRRARWLMDKVDELFLEP